MTVLDPAIRVTPDTLVVSCRVRNTDPDALFVYTTPITGGGDPWPGLAYALVSADGLDLRLRLGSSPLPADLQVPRRAVALAAGLEPGEERTIELRFPLPVVEWYAYSSPTDPAAAGWELIHAYRILLELGFVRGAEVEYLEETDSPDLFEVGGEPYREVVVPLIPDHPVPVRRLPAALRPA